MVPVNQLLPHKLPHSNLEVLDLEPAIVTNRKVDVVLRRSARLNFHCEVSDLECIDAAGD